MERKVRERESKLEKIKLADRLYVKHNSNYTERAEALLKRAKELKIGMRIKGYHDNKLYVTEKGIESLIGAKGRLIIWLNSGDRMGTHYHHEVVYGGHTFVNATRVPIIPVIEAPLVRR